MWSAGEVKRAASQPIPQESYEVLARLGTVGGFAEAKVPNKTSAAEGAPTPVRLGGKFSGDGGSVSRSAVKFGAAAPVIADSDIPGDTPRARALAGALERYGNHPTLLGALALALEQAAQQA